jgi:peptidoglycan-associated lipoprotein
MRRTLAIITGAVVLVIAAACGGGTPPPQVAPQPNADSLARAESARRDSLAREQARRDSIERARRESEERIRRMREDSLGAARRVTDEVRAMVATMVHFDFDKSAIRPGDAQILDQKLAVLQANPNLRIEIVGHCDERGSDEYNLALGNRRGLAAKQYLVSRGISADRIATRSMGKEQPLDPGHTEDAWSKNRRDEFSITAGGDLLMKPPGM